MAEDKRALVQKVLNMEDAPRVPIGFWWHFVPKDKHSAGLQDPGIFDTVVKKQKETYDILKPDFVKLMTDGYFSHPGVVENDIRTVEDLKKIKPIGKDHPWIREQVALTKKAMEYMEGEVMVFYNIFAPMQSMRMYIEYIFSDVDAFQDLIMNHPQDMAAAAKIIGDDTIALMEALKEETAIDGIYYSVQTIQNEKADEAFHDKYVVPSDLQVLDAANELWDNNLIHICGIAGYHNDIPFYKKYKAKAYNWAVHTDDFSLKEGKELFNAAVIGGFDYKPHTVLEDGTDEEVEAFVKDLIEKTGKRGLIIGADCAVPADIDLNRLAFVREVAEKYSR